ncbi:MAG: hypothetical protein LBG66_04830 [Gallionellaceae bacterium]|nr:hypothetical protein [Gallionellaceae bacterium]
MKTKWMACAFAACALALSSCDGTHTPKEFTATQWHDALRATFKKAGGNWGENEVCFDRASPDGECSMEDVAIHYEDTSNHSELFAPSVSRRDWNTMSQDLRVVWRKASIVIRADECKVPVIKINPFDLSQITFMADGVVVLSRDFRKEQAARAKKGQGDAEITESDWITLSEQEIDALRRFADAEKKELHTIGEGDGNIVYDLPNAIHMQAAMNKALKKAGGPECVIAATMEPSR